MRKKQQQLNAAAEQSRRKCSTNRIRMRSSGCKRASERASEDEEKSQRIVCLIDLKFIYVRSIYYFFSLDGFTCMPILPACLPFFPFSSIPSFVLSSATYNSAFFFLLFCWVFFFFVFILFSFTFNLATAVSSIVVCICLSILNAFHAEERTAHKYQWKRHNEQKKRDREKKCWW